jgi:hypothetical protein
VLRSALAERRRFEPRRSVSCKTLGCETSSMDRMTTGAERMKVDLSAANDFMATHARILDRRRFELLNGQRDPSAVLAAVDGYRNGDGGYGWGLEPDLRSPQSQPAGALHAFEAFEDIAPATAPHAAALCDWLESITLPDGGLPFALPLGMTAGSGPWWTAADLSVSSLQITAAVTAAAHRVAAHDPAVAGHPWLQRATDYCLRAIESIEEPPFAYVLAFSVHLLDAVHDSRPDRADALLDRLCAYVPDDGKVLVRGGTEDEMLRPLDLAPHPDRPARRLLSAEVVAADLDRLVAGQRDDGGWTVDYLKISPAGSLDWRGHATVRAISVLRENGTIASPEH